jgi:hypothetical protein
METGLKRLIAILVKSFFKDLRAYINDPDVTEVILFNNHMTPKNLVNFWQNDAFVFLKFLYGAAIAEKMIEKINPLVARAVEIQQAREFYYKFFVEEFFDTSPQAQKFS